MFMKNCHGKRNLTPKQYESVRIASIKANYLTWSDNDYKKKMKQKFKDGAAKRRETYKKHPELLDNMKKKLIVNVLKNLNGIIMEKRKNFV